MRDRLFHDARAFDDLRQEHLAGAEQIADHVHRGHQRPFDDVERAIRGEARLLGIGHDERVDAFNQRVPQTFLHRRAAPLRIVDHGFVAARRVFAGDCEQLVGGVGPTIQHDVLYAIAQRLRNLVVDAQLTRVDDAHRKPRANRVVQEHRVDRFANGIVASKRERHVADATRAVRVRQILFDPRAGLNEVDRVVVVLFDAGGDRKDVRIEDDVFGGKTDLLYEDVVRALADVDLARERVGLAVFVESHHDDGRTVQPAAPRFLDELRFAFFQADRVDDRLALNAAQTGFDDVPLARIDHHRHARDVGFCRDEIEKARHQRSAVEHAFVHVDVDDLRAVVDLIARDVERRFERAFANQFLEPRGAGDVGAFPDVHEQRRLVDLERFESGEAQLARQVRQRARSRIRHCRGDRCDVFRRRAAATADQIHEPATRRIRRSGAPCATATGRIRRTRSASPHWDAR